LCTGGGASDTAKAPSDKAFGVFTSNIFDLTPTDSKDKFTPLGRTHLSSPLNSGSTEPAFGSQSAHRGGNMKSRMLASITRMTLFAALTISVRLPAQEQPDNHRYGQEPKLVEFDAPRAGTVSSPACAPYCGTFANANNDLGAIVGYYTDAKVVPHGLLRTPSGRIISFDAPGAGLGAGLNEGTVAYSINDLGVIAGEFEDSRHVYHGFVRYPDDSYATFEAPDAGRGANQGTLVLSMNLEGATAGVYIDSSNVQHGFARSRNGEITSFDPAGSVYTMVCEETCLNLEGAITGYYSDASGVIHGFLRERDGNIMTFDAPGAVQLTLSASINIEGAIAGYYYDSKIVAHGFVRSRDGNFTTFEAPGAATGPVQGSAAFSINLLGAVAGEFLDASYASHGFARLPNGNFTMFDAPGAGTGASQGTRPSTSNMEGAVAGWWVDASNLNHGFVWIPGDWSLR
jgi:hypothetical protein